MGGDARAVAQERVVPLRVDGEDCVGILHEPPGPVGGWGVVIVVGGPQYRVGSHRQFVQLARSLAAAGVAVLRFDCRGMGDSGGARREFDAIDRDVGEAVAALRAAAPGVRRVALWGLCDGASAAAFHAAASGQVDALAIVNPWVRSTAGEAQARIATHYRQRLLDRAFWRRVLGGEVQVVRALRGLLGTWLAARRTPPQARRGPAPLPERVRDALVGFAGPLLWVDSQDDLTAAEFRELVAREPALAARMASARVASCAADHTFSGPGQQAMLEQASLEWLRALAVQTG